MNAAAFPPVAEVKHVEIMDMINGSTYVIEEWMDLDMRIPNGSDDHVSQARNRFL
jgi:hypothetical protein